MVKFLLDNSQLEKYEWIFGGYVDEKYLQGDFMQKTIKIKWAYWDDFDSECWPHKLKTQSVDTPTAPNTPMIKSKE